MDGEAEVAGGGPGARTNDRVRDAQFDRGVVARTLPGAGRVAGGAGLAAADLDAAVGGELVADPVVAAGAAEFVGRTLTEEDREGISGHRADRAQGDVQGPRACQAGPAQRACVRAGAMVLLAASPARLHRIPQGRPTFAVGPLGEITIDGRFAGAGFGEAREGEFSDRPAGSVRGLELAHQRPPSHRGAFGQGDLDRLDAALRA